MKQGQAYPEAMSELRRIAESATDYIADTRHIEVSHNPISKEHWVDFTDGTDLHFSLRDNAHQQIGARTGIPKKYYDRMRVEQPQLLADNINTWFREEPESRMLRTIDAHCRAFVSDRFRRIDNWDVMRTVSPIINEQPDMQVASCHVNENRFYLKCIFPRMEMEAKVGDVVQAGIVISNSEVGLGSFKIEPLILVLRCLNGMVCPESGVSRRHVGSQIKSEDGSDAFRIFRDETMQADDKALMMKIEDVTRAATQEARFATIVERLRENADQALTLTPPKAVEVLTKKFDLTENENDLVFTKLAEGRDYTTYGMVQAITAAAGEAEDYDRATFLERLGGQVSAEPQLLAA